MDRRRNVCRCRCWLMPNLADSYAPKRRQPRPRPTKKVPPTPEAGGWGATAPRTVDQQTRHKKRGRCQRTIPVPRVTPPRLLLRHAKTTQRTAIFHSVRRQPIIYTGVTGAEGQPIRRHHRGRRHNSQIRHQALPSHTTGHRTHPVPQTYNPHPLESTGFRHSGQGSHARDTSSARHHH